MIADTIDFANQLTGEAIGLDVRMTELSGGQTRALLIADATMHLRHADRAARRGRERRHRPLPMSRAAAPAAQDLHLRHPRPAHRAAFGLSHRDQPRAA